MWIVNTNAKAKLKRTRHLFHHLGKRILEENEDERTKEAEFLLASACVKNSLPSPIVFILLLATFHTS